MTTPRKHEFSPTPTEVLRYFLIWLRGFHLDRERSRAADWAMVFLTIVAVVAAIASAWLFQKQLVEARRSTDAAIHDFRVDERAWLELEPIKGTLSSPKTVNIGAGFEYPVYIRNVGKTVARDIEFRASRNGSQSSITMGDNTESLAWEQDKLLLGKVPTAKDIPITIATPTVLAPNSSTPTPTILFGQEPQVFTKDEWVSYLIGRVDYIDEFGVRHWIKFCFFVADAKGNLWNCKQGNDEDRSSEAMTSDGTRRASSHALVWGIVTALVTGLLTSLMASFFYSRFTSRARELRLREQFADLAGEYQETERNAQGFPVATGGKVVLTYCGGTRFKTKGVMLNGELLWEGELFMSEEAGVLGRGFYSHTTRDDTGIHQVVHNPASGHLNVSGENTSHADGRKFKMAWMPLR
jgi:hypothetical protein